MKVLVGRRLARTEDAVSMHMPLEPADIQILRGVLRRLLGEMRDARESYAGLRLDTTEPSRRSALDLWLALQRRANLAQAQLLEAERRQGVSLVRAHRGRPPRRG